MGPNLEKNFENRHLIQNTIFVETGFKPVSIWDVVRYCKMRQVTNPSLHGIIRFIKQSKNGDSIINIQNINQNFYYIT